jgi:O-antigen/teichoic acid export membrane protein
MSQPGITRDLRRLTSKTGVYAVGMMLLRGLNFLLLPLYTRILTGEDYGIIAVVTTFSSLLIFLLPLGVHNALAKTYHDSKSNDERKAAIWTHWVAMLATAGALAVGFDLAGAHVIPHLMPGIPFHPFFRLAIWGAFFQLPIQFLYNVFIVREQASRYVAAATTVSLLTLALVIYFVVIRRQGAYGYVLGTTLGAAICGIMCSAVTLRMAKCHFRRELVVPMLALGLPLVPHLTAGWLLELSDRFLLKRFVSLEDVGLYSVGYQIGMLISVAVACFVNAWNPFLLQRLQQPTDETNRGLARLVTYYLVAVGWCALGLIVFAPQAVWMMTSPDFHDASRIVPWVVMGQLCSAMYVIASSLLFAKGKSWVLPAATITAGAANVTANLWLVPQYGYIAAAWTTFGSYIIMLAITWWAAHIICPLPYEYRRMGVVAVAFSLVLALHAMLPQRDLAWSTVEDIVLWLSFPGLLFAIGFVDASEQAKLRSLVQRVRGAWNARLLARDTP